MNTVKSFLAGMLVMLILAVVGYAVWIIATNGRSSNTSSLLNSVPITQPQAAEPTPGGVIMNAAEESSEPAVRSLIPTAVPVIAPAATATAVPETIIDYANDVLGQPTRDYDLTNDQLAACIQAQQTGRRLAPYCPPNPAEYAGQGR